MAKIYQMPEAVPAIQEKSYVGSWQENLGLGIVTAGFLTGIALIGAAMSNTDVPIGYLLAGSATISAMPYGFYLMEKYGK